MLSNIFKWINAIPRVTRILSKSDIQVRYQGDGAYTIVDNTGRPILINLPTLPSNISQKELDLTFGYMFHELGHVNYTDFTIAPKNNLDVSSPVGQMFNLLEDTFVEKSIAPDFLEAKQYLVHCQRFIEEHVEQLLKQYHDPNEVAVIMLVPKVRLLAGDTSFYTLVKNNHCKELDFLDKFEEEIKNISSTQESYDLAVKIYNELKQNVELPKNSSLTKQASGSGNSQQQQGSGSKDKQEEQLGQAMSNVSKELDAFKEIRAEGTEDKTNKQNSQSSKAHSNGNQTPSGPCKILKDFNSNVYRVVDRSADGFWEIPSEYNPSTVENLTPNVNILTMKQKLIRLFAAKNKKSVIKGVRSGKICNSNLFRLRLDDNRVFKKNYENNQLNTAITLLIDCSGSMSGGRDQCAISAAYLFAKILNHLNIPCEVLGFSTGNDYFRGVGRNVSVKVGIFKSFAEKLTPKVLGRFCFFYNGKRHSNYYNCNDDGESILIALTNLANRPESRKMIFVMSDGQPNSCGCEGKELNHLKDVVKDIETTPGFEIYGIGIQTQAVKKFYSNYSVLDNPEDLSKVIIQQLSKNIL